MNEVQHITGGATQAAQLDDNQFIGERSQSEPKPNPLGAKKRTPVE
jgi:hypothetical protein